MPAKRTIRLFFSLFVFLHTSQFTICQTTFPEREWTRQLEANDDSQFKNFQTIQNELIKSDSSVVFKTLQELERYGHSSNHYFMAKLHFLKGWSYKHFNTPLKKNYADKPFTEALKESYYTDDTKFISFISWQYGMAMFDFQEIELAATYITNAIELNPDILTRNSDFGSIYQVANVLFHAGDNKKSIYYNRRAIDTMMAMSEDQRYNIMVAWNTLGQAYQKIGNFDSALNCYETSSKIASQRKDEDWVAINAGFLGQVYFHLKQYDKARLLFEYDYNFNKLRDENIAGYSLHWLARILFIQGKKDSALIKMKKAVEMLGQTTSFRLQNRAYLEKVYYATADLYRESGQSDSSYHYFQLYAHLHDSLQEVKVRSSLDVVQLRIDNEKNFHAVQLLQREKKAERLKRNFIIASILLLSVIVVLYINRLRLKHFHKEQLMQQQKNNAEVEVITAKEQLEMFKQNIVEKTNLIEKLEQQASDKEATAGQQQIMEELAHQTILTEEDWEKFKTLFKKIYPGFFLKLKQKAPDITIAEQRMAALIRLYLTSKQIASMLGISPESVQKSKRRLRLRLQLNDEINLEESIERL